MIFPDKFYQQKSNYNYNTIGFHNRTLLHALIIQMSNRQPTRAPVKMLAFLDTLHSKYKVLSKLTDKESDGFQNEVITLLVDQNENVDPQAYKQVQSEIGLDGFVLDILSNVMQRSPYSNQHELKRDIVKVADELQIKSKQVNKKLRIIERREEEMSKLEAGLKQRVRQYTMQVQKQSMGRLLAKESEIKKQTNTVLNTVKAKEKLVLERRDDINRKLQEMGHKEKVLTALNRDKQTKLSRLVQESKQSTKNDRFQQGKELRQAHARLQESRGELDKMRKKYRTTDMAYSKIKQELESLRKKKDEMEMELEAVKKKNQQFVKKAKEQQDEEGADSSPIVVVSRRNNSQIRQLEKRGMEAPKPLIQMLEELELSQIDIDSKKDGEGPHVDQLVDLPRSNKEAEKRSKISISNVIKNRSMLADQGAINQEPSDAQECNPSSLQKCSPSNGEDEKTHGHQQSQFQFPECLRVRAEEQGVCQLLQQLSHFDLQRDSEKERLMSSQLIPKFVRKESYQISKRDLLTFCDILFELIQQPSTCYSLTIDYLNSSEILKFLQGSYLNYEANSEICEGVTLILSRICLQNPCSIRLSPSFLASLNLRLKMQVQGLAGEELLVGNIKSVLHNSTLEKK